jgi:hypothetical protein
MKTRRGFFGALVGIVAGVTTVVTAKKKQPQAIDVNIPLLTAREVREILDGSIEMTYFGNGPNPYTFK